MQLMNVNQSYLIQMFAKQIIGNDVIGILLFQ